MTADRDAKMTYIVVWWWETGQRTCSFHAATTNHDRPTYLSIFNVHLFSAAIHSFNQFNYHSLSVLTKQLL